MCSERVKSYIGLSETAERKLRTLKGERLARFKKKLQDCSPPELSTGYSSEAVIFIKKAQNISKPSFSGFGGLDRAEIKLSFENFKDEFVFLKSIEDIGWAIEFLDDKLKEFYSNKKEE